MNDITSLNLPKPQMKFKASLLGSEVILVGACPHAKAWIESMGKYHIKPTELHWVGKMGIELAVIEGKVNSIRKELGKDKVTPNGIVKFDALDSFKRG